MIDPEFPTSTTGEREAGASENAELFFLHQPIEEKFTRHYPRKVLEQVLELDQALAHDMDDHEIARLFIPGHGEIIPESRFRNTIHTHGSISGARIDISIQKANIFQRLRRPGRDVQKSTFKIFGEKIIRAAFKD